MSYSDPSNPYSSPPSAAGGPNAGWYPQVTPISGMDYMRMVTYVFDNPNWLMNIVLVALCSLIPIVGAIVVLGYQYEVVVALLANQGTRYPDFDFGRFVDYLMRGLWPFFWCYWLARVPFCLFCVCSGWEARRAKTFKWQSE